MKGFRSLFAAAHAAGMAAGNAAVPQPMIVGSPSSLFANDIDPRQPIYHVPEGVCGFAWVHIPNGRHPFVNECRNRKIGHKNYHKGWDVWVRDFGQSMARKEAYARAFAGVLKEAGIEAYADSRMD